jgi:preprotein translocase subunit SecD
MIDHGRRIGARGRIGMKGPTAVAAIAVALVLGRLTRVADKLGEISRFRQGLPTPEEVEPQGLAAGTNLIYEVELRSVDGDPAALPRAALAAKDVLERRLKALGIGEFRVFVRGTRLAVQVPTLDAESIRPSIEGIGAASFHIVAPDADQTEDQIRVAVEGEAAYLAALRDRLSANTPGVGSPPPSPPRRIARPPAPSATGPKPNPWGSSLTLLENGEDGMVPMASLHDVKITPDALGKPALSYTFPPTWRGRLAKLTRTNICSRCAIVVDGRIVEMATLRGEIQDRSELSGNFREEDLRRIAALLQGKLPAGLRFVSQRPIGPAASGEEGGKR